MFFKNLIVILIIITMVVMYCDNCSKSNNIILSDLPHEKTLKNLYSSGYMILRDALSKQVINDVRKSIKGNMVNYCKNKEFIDKHIIPLIKSVTKWKNPSYYKFRTSNKDNSTDAGVFHRDLNNFTKNKEIFPIYTCICYLDGGIMELIPNTFKDPVMNNYNCCKNFFKSKKVYLFPGDILIFNSLTIHRGIFSDKMPNRRLIQVFEIYPNDKIRSKYSKRILIKSSNKSKNYKFFQNFNIWCHTMIIPSMFLNIIGYVYSSKRFIYPQYNITKKDLNSDKYFAQKATEKINPKPNMFYKSNCYIINKIKIDL